MKILGLSAVFFMRLLVLLIVVAGVRAQFTQCADNVTLCATVGEECCCTTPLIQACNCCLSPQFCLVDVCVAPSPSPTPSVTVSVSFGASVSPTPTPTPTPSTVIGRCTQVSVTEFSCPQPLVNSVIVFPQDVTTVLTDLTATPSTQLSFDAPLHVNGDVQAAGVINYTGVVAISEGFVPLLLATGAVAVDENTTVNLENLPPLERACERRTQSNSVQDGGKTFGVLLAVDTRQCGSGGGGGGGLPTGALVGITVGSVVCAVLAVCVALAVALFAWGRIRHTLHGDEEKLTDSVVDSTPRHD